MSARQKSIKSGHFWRRIDYIWIVHTAEEVLFLTTSYKTGNGSKATFRFTVTDRRWQYLNLPVLLPFHHSPLHVTSKCSWFLPGFVIFRFMQTSHMLVLTLGFGLGEEVSHLELDHKAQIEWGPLYRQYERKEAFRLLVICHSLFFLLHSTASVQNTQKRITTKVY